MVGMIYTKTTPQPKLHVPELGRVIRFKDGQFETDDDEIGAALLATGEVVDEDGNGDDGSEALEPDLFDPSKHKVDEVLAYLETVDDDEAARVKAAEAAGKNRSGIVSTTAIEEELTE